MSDGGFSSSPPRAMEYLNRPAQAARSTPFDLASIVRACPAAVSESDAASLGSWRIPTASADGTCSSAKLSAAPFSIIGELTTAGAEQTFALRRLWVMRKVAEELSSLTGAQWAGVYEVVTSVRSDAGGDTPCLLKLAYVGSPSRAWFPLTTDFAAKSNNSAVALSGDACIIHDVRRLPPTANYYECDGKVRSEACVPILSSHGNVIGLIDVESFAPQAFDSPSMVGYILGAAAALGAADLCRGVGALDTSNAWRAGVSNADLNRGAEALQDAARAASERDPLVGEEEPITALAADYVDNPAFSGKLADLNTRYVTVQRVRGDGNCFYRALLVGLGLAFARGGVRALVPTSRGAFATLDAFCESPRSDVAPHTTTTGTAPSSTSSTSASASAPHQTPLQAVYESICVRVTNGAAALVATGLFPAETTGDFFDSLSGYLQGLAGGSDVDEASVAARALSPLRPDAAGSAMGSFFTLYALRLMCAGELLSGDYADLVFASSAMTVKDFVDAEVTPAGVEADFVQIIALARALGISVRIASIDASTKGDKVSVHTLPDSDGMPPPPLVIDVLYRPGHYDVITPRL